MQHGLLSLTTFRGNRCMALQFHMIQLFDLSVRDRFTFFCEHDSCLLTYL